MSKRTPRDGRELVITMYFTDRNGVQHRRPDGKPYVFWAKPRRK